MAADIERIFQRGRERWPSVALDAVAFERFVTTLDHDEPLDGEDIYLACACALGDKNAIAAFRDAFTGAIYQVFHRMNLRDHADDIFQQVLEALFVSTESRAAQISTFSGRGALVNWVRVLAMRQAYRVVRKERKPVAAPDEAIDRVADADIELGHIKRTYRKAFKRAFQRAFQELSGRERNIFRYQYLHGLNLEQIGTVYDVSRATIARWRSRAQQSLLSGTRRVLGDELRVSRDEFDSVMALIQSQLDVSLTRLLREDSIQLQRKPSGISSA